MVARMRWFAPVLLVLLVGCTGPQPPVAREGDAGEARALLMARAGEGPVPLVILGAPEGLSRSWIARQAARGVRGLDLRFEPVSQVPSRGSFVVLAWLPEPHVEPRRLCRLRVPGSGAAVYLHAAFCEGERPIAALSLELSGSSREATRRRIWRAMQLLFPDDYADRYGLDLFGLRLTVGGTFGF